MMILMDRVLSKATARGDLDDLTDAIMARIEDDPEMGMGVVRRMVRHGTGSTTSYRVDIRHVDAEGFVVAGIRRDGGDRHELAARRLSRGDHAGLAGWLGESA